MTIAEAYDLKALGQKLKDAGLPVAEDALEAEAGKAYIAIKEWLKESAAKSDTQIDDIIVGFEDNLDPIILPLIDKINGKVN